MHVRPPLASILSHASFSSAINVAACMICKVDSALLHAKTFSRKQEYLAFNVGCASCAPDCTPAVTAHEWRTSCCDADRRRPC